VNLHYSGRAVGVIAKMPSGLFRNRVAGEHMGLAALAAEHCPFRGYRQTVQCLLPNTFSERG